MNQHKDIKVRCYNPSIILVLLHDIVNTQQDGKYRRPTHNSRSCPISDTNK